MKKYLLAGISSLALVSSASAADLVPDFRAVALYNWSGFYAGVHVGGVWGQKIWDDLVDQAFSVSYPISGVLGGVHGGWNFQTGPLVFGIEGTLAFSNARGSAPTVNALRFGHVSGFINTPPTSVNLNETANAGALESQINSLLTLVGRGGISSGTTLYYLLGGLAVANEEHKAQFNGLWQVVKQTRAGFTLGFGAEFAAWQNWTAKIEYNYMDFGKKTIAFSANIEDDVLWLNQNLHVVKLGLSYIFH